MPRLRETKTTAGRRANNTGGITQRKDGRWVCSITTGYKSDGKLIRKQIYFKSKHEAERGATLLSADVIKGGYRNVLVKTNTDLRYLMTEWYELFKVDSLADPSNEKNLGIMRLHIFPALGKFDVKDIDTERIQRFINKMKREKLEGGFGYSKDSDGGYSSDYIKKTKNLLEQFYKYAVRKNLVPTNPVPDVDVRVADKDASVDLDEKGKALRPELRVTVFSAVEDNPVLKPILMTLSMQGLRTQELIALKWKNLDIEQKELRVREAIKRTITRDDAGNIIAHGSKLGSTKTKTSQRSIAIPPVLLDVLLEWKEYCHLKGIKTDSEAFVFPNTDRGKKNSRRTYSSLRSLFMRFVIKHGLEDESLTLYMFRHTFATMLLEEKVNPKIVSEMMGHASIKTTLDIYSAVFKATYTEAAGTLHNAFMRMLAT